MHALNTVTVPVGFQCGTDSGDSSRSRSSKKQDHDKQEEHTLYGVIYDHLNATMYWRTDINHSFQRLRLADMDLKEGSRIVSIHSHDQQLPWFIDAAASFKANKQH
mmetsp:Transcript_21413/g.40112  ORF Transcript_21413/g.40112 Transcript_21413/m.40112 type:complete len:106 (-) Transcript_21413:421-738(-)